MPESDAIFKGAEFGELPDSPEIDTTRSGRTAVRRYMGTWAECLANEPKPLDTYPDMPGFLVSRTKVKYGYPYATLTVDLVTSKFDPGDDDDDDIQLAGAIWYRDKTEIIKPLELHPIYQQGGTKQIAGSPLNLETISNVWGLIAEWKTATAPRKKVILEEELPASGGNMTGINHLIERLARNQDTFPIDAPVIKAVIQSLRPLRGLKGYVRDTPNHPIVPSGYQWLYTGPAVVFRQDSGVYETTHEWIGAESIDADLYPPGGPGL